MSALLAALLLAAPANVATAKALAAKQRWDQLYLAFAAGKPDSFPAKDRAAISSALTHGCEAVLASDAVMAYSLGDRAAAFDPSPPALLCLAHGARKTEQRGAAEKALRLGLVRYPKDGAIALLLGKQLLEDQDGAHAAEILAKVPAHAKEHAEAARLLAKARALARSDRQAYQQAKAIERRIAHAKPVDGTASNDDAPPDIGWVSSVGKDGMQTRASKRFVLKYFNDQRDFRQRAEYEGHLIDAMETAADFEEQVLGQARRSPVSVVLYTRDEFATHLGARTAQAAAGLYFEDAMRINDAAQLTDDTRATLVHEYTHAVVDEVCDHRMARLPTWLNEGIAEYVEWRFQGREDPVFPIRVELRSEVEGHRLPKLAQLRHGQLLGSDSPAVRYAQSAVAVRLLLEQGGPAKLLGMIAQVCRGTGFDAALQATYGHGEGALDEDLADTLGAK